MGPGTYVCPCTACNQHPLGVSLTWGILERMRGFWYPCGKGVHLWEWGLPGDAQVEGGKWKVAQPAWLNG